MKRLFTPEERAAARITDSERDARIDRHARELEDLIRAERDDFRLDLAVAELGIDPDDCAEAAERAYERAVTRTYHDQVVTERERLALNWIAARLELDEPHRGPAETRVGCAAFEAYLNHALADGLIDRIESSVLQGLANSLGRTVDELVQEFFAQRGEDFLRGQFAAVLRDGDITDEEWSRLSRAAEGLNLGRERMLSLIGGQAERHVRILIDEAHANGVPAPKIRTAIGGLLARLPLSPRFRADIDAKLAG